VAYDPRFWVASAQDLEAEGLPMVEIPQTPARMVPIIGSAYTTIVERKLTHTPDPTFRQQVLSAIPRPSESGFTLYKQRAGNAFKIDACIALVMALSVTDIPAPSGALISMY
jgi:phage terminase large subunit-like protein